MDIFRLTDGETPLIVSMPHAGTFLPEDLAPRMTAEGQSVPDTDWHMEQLYGFAEALGATLLSATHSRYVIDLNRPPDGASLYPGADETELCPTTTFDRTPIYLPGEEPDQAEVETRRARYWDPYHQQLSAAIEQTKARHGHVILWEAHSIRSQLPRFFQGRLPDLNFGTGDGRSCDRRLIEQVFALAKEEGAYSSVLNGRYKGGHITRTYGDPEGQVHAIQLELSQITYMYEKPPFEYRPAAADRLIPALSRFLEAALAWTVSDA
jgi:N-formylglutamate deformylase